MLQAGRASSKRMTANNKLGGRDREGEMVGILREFVQLLRIAAILAIAVGSVSASGAATGRVPALNYDDRTEIDDLFSRYSYYIDNRAGEAFAGTFTQDGRLEFPGVVVKGHDQLVAFGSRPAEDKIRFHFVGSILLVPVAPGHVRARSMVIIGMRDIHGTAPATFDGVGVYEDDIVRTPDGWRFAARHAGATLPLSPEFLPAGMGGGK
jgi:hypothetical protein